MDLSVLCILNIKKIVRVSLFDLYIYTNLTFFYTT